MLDKIDFVNSLDVNSNLPMLDSGRLITSTTDKPSGYIVAGSLVSFVSGISAQSQKDVLNSTLLAQLAANKKFNRETQTQAWYEFYRTVLENVGWTLQGFNFSRVSASGSSFTADRVVIELIAALATGDQVTILKATMDALKKLNDSDGRLVLFEQGSHSASKGNFQMAAAQEENEALALTMGAFHFKTTQNVTRVLWFSYSSSDTEFYQSGQGMTLNKDVYARVRNAIIDKLGDKAERFVAELEI